jgi:outer membrane protein
LRQCSTAILMILLASAASAQTTTTSTTTTTTTTAPVIRLSLDEALQRALYEGATARLAQSAAERSRIAEREALTGLLPQGDARLMRSNESVNLEEFGFTLPGIPSVIGPFNVYQAQVSAAAQLFNLAALRLYQSRHAAAGAGRYEVARAESDVAASVSRLYVMAQRADAQIVSRQADMKLFEDLLRVANDELEAGTGTKLDVAQARLQLSRARSGWLAAQNDRTAAALALLNAIGESQASDVVLTDPVIAAAPAPDVDAALAAAREQRPEIKALEAHLREAQLAFAAARAQYLPTLAIEFAGDYGGLQTSNLLWTRRITAVASVPLFRGTIPANIARARLEAQDLETRLGSLRGDVEQDVRTAVLTLRNAEERVSVAEEQVQVAEEALTIARDRKSAGYGSTVEVDRAEDQYQQAHEALIAARADAALANVQLRRATGDLRPANAQPAQTGAQGIK